MKLIFIRNQGELGVIGKETILVDRNGVKLHIGDTVDIYTNGKRGLTNIPVIEDEGESFVYGMYPDPEVDKLLFDLFGFKTSYELATSYKERVLGEILDDDIEVVK